MALDPEDPHLHQRDADDDDTQHRRWTDTGNWRCRNYWTAVGVIPRWQLVAVYLFIAAIGIVAIGSVARQSDEIEAQANRATALAIQNRQLSKASAELARRVQQQRLDGIRSNCEDQNRKHGDTIRSLRASARRLKIPRSEWPERLGPTIRLINALAEVRDCDTVIKEASALPSATPTPSPTP